MNIAVQLQQARLAQGEDLCTLAQRIGVRQEHLRAIEDGRFADLPPGIYGRAAVRHFANAFGFDGAAALAECEPLLRPLEEPIAALARANGLRARPNASVPRDGETPPDPATESPFAGWQHLAAAVVDAVVVAGLLMVVVIAALTFLTMPISALRHSGPAFGVMSLVLGAAYFLCFGGVRGSTIGERALGLEAPPIAGPVTIAIALERAMLAATADVRCVQRWSERAGRFLAEWIDDAADQRAKRSA